jgi:hypothetical protein
MNESLQFADERLMGRRYEYGDRTVLAVDLGHVADASVDIVDGTVIVVTASDQYEFALPEAASADLELKNGILTVSIKHSEDEVEA